MAHFRTFVSNHSPMLATIAAIIGIYAMAICIGCSLAVTV